MLEKIKVLTVNHPMTVKLIIFPFLLMLVMLSFKVLTEIILPIIIALLITKLLYSLITNRVKRDSINNFSFIYKDPFRL